MRSEQKVFGSGAGNLHIRWGRAALRMLMDAPGCIYNSRPHRRGGRGAAGPGGAAPVSLPPPPAFLPLITTCEAAGHGGVPPFFLFWP